MGQSRTVESPDSSLFAFDAAPAPARIASALALPAAPNHYDELRGGCNAPLQALTPEWSAFFEALGADGFKTLDERSADLQRKIRDNGITFNVHADAADPQRPWSLDLFPLIVPSEDWRAIEAGVIQRAHLLDRIMADVYGAQQLLARGLLPSALVHGHPGYLRGMHGVTPPGGNYLHIVAFDLARGEDGHWVVVSQRCQAPSGLGYLLENRLIVSRQFPQAFEKLRVQRLAAGYGALLNSLRRALPEGQDARIVLLTPGPYNETYFEHAYLARYLNVTLVEGADLTVREQQVFIKTMQGLEPVHGIIKRLDDEFLDPLELRPDSTLGVPGLLQAVRAGTVLLTNAPGSAFLESAALLGFLPALSEHLTGQPLQLPSLSTWWCGERAALSAVLPELADRVIVPTRQSEAMTGRLLSAREREEWAGRLALHGEDYTVQDHVALSQMPVWFGQRIAPRSLLLRVFALSDGPGAWRVLPGGLTRLMSVEGEVASMQRGGSSADTWVLTDGEIDRSSLIKDPADGPASTAASRKVTSRTAENMFWLGRYTERSENTVALALLVLSHLQSSVQQGPPGLTAWLGELASRHALVPAAAPPAALSPRVFERTLIAGLTDERYLTSVGYNLRAIGIAAAALRERLSLAQWELVRSCAQDFFGRLSSNTAEDAYSGPQALRALQGARETLSAMSGAQHDRMTRDDGWRLLTIGRLIERCLFIATTLQSGLQSGVLRLEAGAAAALRLFDGETPFATHFSPAGEADAVLQFLVGDDENPRSLAWVVRTLRKRVAQLQESTGRAIAWPGNELMEPMPAAVGRAAAGDLGPVLDQLGRLIQAARELSDEMGMRFFTHTDGAPTIVGA